MLLPHRPAALGSLLAAALLSACTYVSSSSMGPGSSTTQTTWHQGTFSMTRVEAGSTSTFQLSGDLTPGLDMQSLVWMEPGSNLTIHQTKGSRVRSIQATPDGNGAPLLVYSEAGKMATFELVDQGWYADRLGELFEHSALGAENYAAAVLDQEGVAGLIQRAGELENPDRAIVCLVAAMDAPGLSPEQCLGITDVIFEMGYESSRVDILEQLANRHKDNSDLTLALISRLDDFSGSSQRQDAILAMTGRELTEANLLALLDATRGIDYDSNRKETLLELAPLHPLQGDWTLGLVEAAGELDYSSSLQEVIESLSTLEVATDDDWVQLVAATEEIGHDGNMVEALEALISRMPGNDDPLLAATGILSKLSYSSSQEEIVEALAKRKNMSPTVWAAIAGACKEIDYDSTRSDSLVAILASAPADLGVHMAVLDVAKTIGSSSDMAEVLLALATYCAAEPGLGIAVAKACNGIDHQSNREDVLVEVIGHLPAKAADRDAQLAACAKATEDMHTSSYQAAVLRDILDQPVLGHTALKAVTRAVEEVDSESTRAGLQKRLIQHLVDDK